MPIAIPTRAGSSPPGYLAASSANTGSTRNRPSMRAAKIVAREPLARRSVAVMRADLAEPGEEVIGQTQVSPAADARQTTDCPACPRRPPTPRRCPATPAGQAGVLLYSFGMPAANQA